MIHSLLLHRPENLNVPLLQVPKVVHKSGISSRLCGHQFQVKRNGASVPTKSGYECGSVSTLTSFVPVRYKATPWHPWPGSGFRITLCCPVFLFPLWPAEAEVSFLHHFYKNTWESAWNKNKNWTQGLVAKPSAVPPCVKHTYQRVCMWHHTIESKKMLNIYNYKSITNNTWCFFFSILKINV